MSKKSSLLATAPRAVLTDECGEAVKQWLFYSKQLEEAKTFELALRQQIGSTLFPSPVEGVNRVIVELDGKATEIVLDHKINRALDETVLDTVMNELPPDSPYRQVGVLVAYAPKLVLKGLRSMPNDQRLIFSQALTEKAGTPALHINEIDEGHAPETAPAQPDWPATRSASCMTSEQLGVGAAAAAALGRDPSKWPQATPTPPPPPKFAAATMAPSAPPPRPPAPPGIVVLAKPPAPPKISVPAKVVRAKRTSPKSVTGKKLKAVASKGKKR